MVKRRSSAKRSPLPGEAVMLGMVPKRRSALRLVTRRTARLKYEPTALQEYVAFVRDISTRGAFFFSDFSPTPGDRLHLVVEFLSGSNKLRLHLKGSVVRVENPAPGCAPGIAVSFDAYD